MTKMTLERIKYAELLGWKFDWTNAGCHITPPGEESSWDATDGMPGCIDRFLDFWKVPQLPE